MYMLSIPAYETLNQAREIACHYTIYTLNTDFPLFFSGSTLSHMLEAQTKWEKKRYNSQEIEQSFYIIGHFLYHCTL